ncbi:MAG TPA: hypothetical protein VHB02_04140 [Acidimicrobiales bacterium]|nr:hypothetical protein [Acidimicrobiales bacterium]
MLPSPGDQAAATAPPRAAWADGHAGAAVGGAEGVLSSVSCPTTVTCYAVGNRGVPDGPTATALIERFVGRRWSVVPSPPAAGWLTGISCPSPTFCVAVGSQGSSATTAGGQPLVEELDGRSWSVVTGPSVADPGGRSGLTSVSCVADRRCVAVGGSQQSGTLPRQQVEEPLVWTLAGDGWRAASPPPGWQGVLHGVSCTATGCMAVGAGTASPAGGVEVGVLDGSMWQPVPDPSGLPDAVSCASGSRCTVVGSTSGVAAAVVPWVARWQPGPVRWQRLSSRGTPAQQTVLAGVDCSGPDACVAVGTAGPPLGGSLGRVQRHGLVEECSGTACRTARLPEAKDVSLRAVACPAANHCVAVGLSATLAFTRPPIPTLPTPHPRPYAVVEHPAERPVGRP